MTTIQANNRNKTTFNVSYNHDLPYKKSIRPDMSYGEWIKNRKKLLTKVTLTDIDFSLFKNSFNNINVLGFYVIENEIWIDLEDLYLVMPYNKQIENKIRNNNFILAVYHNDQIVAAFGE